MPNDPTAFYIQCDECDEWYHGNCVGVTEGEGEKITSWFCHLCVGVKQHLVVGYNPVCGRDECDELSVTESKYCSETCGVLVQAAKFALIIPTLPFIAQSRPFVSPLAKENFDALQLLYRRRERRRTLIRSLEAHQLFIDACVARSYAHYSLSATSLKSCGFDGRINDDWAVDVDVVPIGDHSPASKTEDIEGEGEVCGVVGKCVRHDGWQSILTREIEAELEEQIRWYVKEKRMEFKLTARLVPLSSTPAGQLLALKQQLI